MWFYTDMADSNEFIPSLHHMVERDTTSNKGAEEMVESDYFNIGKKNILSDS